MHGQELRCDGRAQRAAFSILSKIKMQWNPRCSYREHPLGFCILGIRHDTARERQYFGSDERESNMHRRFLRTAIQYSLKKFYDLATDNQLSLFHFYHDENPNLEQNQLLISRWMLEAIMRDCSYCLSSFSNRIEFISSTPHISQSNASYLIQIADMLAWLVQRGTRRAASQTSVPDDSLLKLIYLWKTEFLPSLIVDRGELYRDETIDRDLKSLLFTRSKMCHLSCFPDDHGMVYRPRLEDFNY